MLTVDTGGWMKIKSLVAVALQISFLAIELAALELSFLRTIRTPVLVATPFLFCVLLLRSQYFGDPWGTDTTKGISNGTKWRVSVTTIVLSLGLPVIFVFLATSGGSRSAVLAMFLGAPGHLRPHYGLVPDTLTQIVCLPGIPILLVAIPQFLHSHGRVWRENSPVPTWLAGFAAVLTVVYILTLHFGFGGLAKTPVGALSVAAFGTGILLAPFYRIVISACWESGITMVFDPGRWWSAWSLAYREMRHAPAEDVVSSGALGTEDVRIPADGSEPAPES
jgi:hypothetical protein